MPALPGTILGPGGTAGITLDSSPRGAYLVGLGTSSVELDFQHI